MTAPDVLEKAKAAIQYCKYATEHNRKIGAKDWKYLLIPHSEVQLNSSFGYLSGKHVLVEA